MDDLLHRHPRLRDLATLAMGLLLLTLGGVETQADLADPDSETWVDPVVLVQEQLPCTNPQAVATMLFGATPRLEFFEAERTGFTTQDLGDGTVAQVVTPMGGNGRWAYRPIHFLVVEQGGGCRKILSAGASTHLLEEHPKVQGRYQLEQVWEGWPADEPITVGPPGAEQTLSAGTATLFERRLFWDGDAYRTAFTKTTYYPPEGDLDLPPTLEWDDRQAYEAARHTWTHTVTAGETASELSERTEIPLEELVEQNQLSHPGRLTTGQVLRWEKPAPDAGDSEPDAL